MNRSREASIDSKQSFSLHPGHMRHRHSMVPPNSFDRRCSTTPQLLQTSKYNNSQQYLSKKSKSICELSIADRKMSTHFKQRTEKSGLVLGSIVLTFLFCHTFRLVIQVYEVTHPSGSTAERFMLCHDQGR